MVYFEIDAEIRTIDCEEVVSPPRICVYDTIYQGAVNQLKLCANPKATFDYVKVYLWAYTSEGKHYLLNSVSYKNEDEFWQSVREAIK
jgi:hypothetical protein